MLFDLVLQINNMDILNSILDNPILDDNYLHPLFLLAIKYEYIELLDFLISKYQINNFNALLENDSGDKIESEIMCSFKNNNIEFCKYLLLNLKIDFNLSSICENNDFQYKNQNLLLDIMWNAGHLGITLISKLYYNDFGDMNICGKYDKETVLTIALKNNSIEIVKLLLSNPDIDVNFQHIKNCKIETPLNIAIQNGNLEIIDMLLSNPKIDVNFSPKSKNKSYYDIKNFRYEGETALTTAIMCNNLTIVKLLLSRPEIDVNGRSIYYDPYIQEKTALHVAVENGNPEIIKQLLSHPKIDVNSLSREYKNDYKFVKKYAEKAPIHIAIEKENLEIIKLLLMHQNIDINSEMFSSDEDEKQRNVQRKTAFHIAIEKRNIEIIKLFLSIPMLNLNSKICIENYVFEYSKIVPNEAIIEIVSKYQARDEYAIFTAKTPLYFAVENEDLELLKLLFEREDIDNTIKSEFVDQKTCYGHGDRKGVKYFYEKTRRTVFDAVNSQDNKEIIQLLQRKNNKQ